SCGTNKVIGAKLCHAGIPAPLCKIRELRGLRSEALGDSLRALFDLVRRYAVEEFQVLFGEDRKSTRLNSSVKISYAVFCLKKKKSPGLPAAQTRRSAARDRGCTCGAQRPRPPAKRPPTRPGRAPPRTRRCPGRDPTALCTTT